MEENKKDFWDKIVALAKFLGGLGAVIGSVAIPLIISMQSEKNRRAQIYAEIMSQREAKDTEIRARMFETLLSSYIKRTSQNEIEDLQEKILFLGLLMENFQEYFSARHLFKDLYNKIESQIKKNHDKEELENLKKQLIKLAKRTASNQVLMLSRVGRVSGQIAIFEGCENNAYIPLFPINAEVFNSLYNEENLLDLCSNINCEIGSITKREEPLSEWTPADYNITKSMLKKSKKDFYFLKIKVKEINYPDVKVILTPYKAEIDEFGEDVVINPVMSTPFKFTVSYFDMPYMDNTRLYEGERFSIVLKAICTEENKDENCLIPVLSNPSCNLCGGKTRCTRYPYAVFQIVVFKEEFMTLRDRPLFEEMLRRISSGE